MKKLFVFNILILVFITIACSKPKHLIVGKWQSVDNNDVAFTFDENNLLKISIRGRIFSHKYFVNDEKTVSFLQTSLNIEETESYDLKLISNDEFYLKCQYKGVINGLSRVDPPELCNYKSFKRIQ